MAGRQGPTCSTCSSQASCRPRGSGLWAWLAGWPPGRCSPSPSSFPHRTSGAVQTTSNFQVLIALLKVLQGFCKSSNFLASCLKCIEVQHFTMELKITLLLISICVQNKISWLSHQIMAPFLFQLSNLNKETTFESETDHVTLQLVRGQTRWWASSTFLTGRMRRRWTIANASMGPLARGDNDDGTTS